MSERLMKRQVRIALRTIHAKMYEHLASHYFLEDKAVLKNKQFIEQCAALRIFTPRHTPFHVGLRLIAASYRLRGPDDRSLTFTPEGFTDFIHTWRGWMCLGKQNRCVLEYREEMLRKNLLTRIQKLADALPDIAVSETAWHKLRYNSSFADLMSMRQWLLELSDTCGDESPAL